MFHLIHKCWLQRDGHYFQQSLHFREIYINFEHNILELPRFFFEKYLVQNSILFSTVLAIRNQSITYCILLLPPAAAVAAGAVAARPASATSS